VRWVLNYPGILGGPEKFHETEHLIAYSKDIATKLEKEISVLFLPPIDIREIYKFKKSSADIERTDRILLYAGKYRGFVGNPILPRWVSGEITEIWREGAKKQSRENVLELLATSSCLFIFENSTLITEAVFFDSLIAEYELGSGGVSWSDAENPIDSALFTIENVESRYLESVDRFFVALEREVIIWQEIASKSDYLSPVYLPNFLKLVSRHRISLAIQVFRSQGLFVLLRIMKSFIKRRILFKKVE
jgi:hypothetical protein